MQILCISVIKRTVLEYCTLQGTSFIASWKIETNREKIGAANRHLKPRVRTGHDTGPRVYGLPTLCFRSITLLATSSVLSVGPERCSDPGSERERVVVVRVCVKLRVVVAVVEAAHRSMAPLVSVACASLGMML